MIGWSRVITMPDSICHFRNRSQTKMPKRRFWKIKANRPEPKTGRLWNQSKPTRTRTGRLWDETNNLPLCRSEYALPIWLWQNCLCQWFWVIDICQCAALPKCAGKNSAPTKQCLRHRRCSPPTPDKQEYNKVIIINHAHQLLINYH